MNEKIPETLILIQGEPEYELIDACEDCSFWYSPCYKKKYALLSHDDHGLPIPYPEMETMSAPMGIK